MFPVHIENNSNLVRSLRLTSACFFFGCGLSGQAFSWAVLGKTARKALKNTFCKATGDKVKNNYFNPNNEFMPVPNFKNLELGGFWGALKKICPDILSICSVFLNRLPPVLQTNVNQM